jgi:hypothetical protein
MIVDIFVCCLGCRVNFNKTRKKQGLFFELPAFLKKLLKKLRENPTT